MRLVAPLAVGVALSFLVGCGGSDASEGPPAPGSGTYTLLYRDDFDTLDPTRWQLMTHSWGSNLALFSPDTASAAEGLLTIRLLPAPAGTTDSGGVAKPFLGAEVRSRDALKYGRVTARVKFARGSAVISSLVTIYTPWPADDWNELDVECLGKAPEGIQYNAQVYTGPPTKPPVSTSVAPTPDVFSDALPFDPSADFHVYTVDWNPAGATFSVDDEVRHTWTKNIRLMDLPQNVLLTIWASSSVGWAGAVAAETAEAQAQYDWIELYEYSER
jgi:endo-1,3-1,4-beta-glycanase ExoK